MVGRFPSIASPGMTGREAPAAAAAAAYHPGGGDARRIGAWSAGRLGPLAELIAHLNREVMHHGAEICLLRDLYRASGATTRDSRLVSRRL